MSKWILIEVENQRIGEPESYFDYDTAFEEMKRRYGNLVEPGDTASIKERYASIRTNDYRIDWRIYEVIF